MEESIMTDYQMKTIIRMLIDLLGTSITKKKRKNG
jgi:hypothetical protein